MKLPDGEELVVGAAHLRTCRAELYREHIGQCEALGDDHDLANLGTLIASHPDAIGTAEEIAILHTAMAAQSAKLHAEVRDIVKHLLKDDEKLIRNRIAALWRDAAR